MTNYLLIINSENKILLENGSIIVGKYNNLDNEDTKRNKIIAYIKTINAPTSSTVDITKDRIIVYSIGSNNVVIVVVKDDEKSKLVGGNFQYLNNLEIKSDKIVINAGGNASLNGFQNAFNANIAELYKKFQEARNISIPPSPPPSTKKDDDVWELAYTIFGIPYWRRRVRSISPIFIPTISPVFIPTVRSYSPIKTYSPKTRIGDFLTSPSSDMFGPSVPRSPRGTSPKVPRSPRGSPRSPRSPRSRGGYYEKYMKYKAKYIALKKQLS
jgi:hypothetical protein